MPMSRARLVLAVLLAVCVAHVRAQQARSSAIESGAWLQAARVPSAADAHLFVNRSCTPGALVLHVRAGSGPGNGSRGRPYGTIREALAAAGPPRRCSTTIELEPGEYPERIVVTLPHLRLRNSAGLAVVARAGDPAPRASRAVLRGSIEHLGGGHLEVEAIDVTGTGLVAIRQHGGRMSLALVNVSSMTLSMSDANSGIGLWVSGGGHAVVYRSTFGPSIHSAIRVEDAGSYLWLSDSRIRQAGVHPVMLRQIPGSADPELAVGALVVQRFARAQIEDVVIERNAGVGLGVSQGALVRLDRSAVNHTRRAGASAGFGIYVRTGAALEWANSSVTNAAVCGVVAHDASAVLNGGFITESEIGACVFSPRMPMECLRRGARYMNVGIPLQADGYSPPDRILEGSSPTPRCPTVNAARLPSWWAPPVVRVRGPSAP